MADEQAAKNAHLEGRVTGLERDMQNMSNAVSSLTDTVQIGFAETRRIFEEGETRHIGRLDELHDQIVESTLDTAKRGQWNPGIVLAAVTCGILVGGIFVSFVHMSTASLGKDNQETRDELDRVRGDMKVSIDRMIDSKERLARLEAKMELLHTE